MRRSARANGALVFAVCWVTWCGGICCWAPPTASAREPSTLEDEIRALIRRTGADLDKVGVVVMDDGGQYRALLEPDTPLKPASNQKVLTTAAAVSLLGPDHEFTTRLLATAAPVGGILKGDVYVEGRGDPNISGRFHDGDVLEVLRSWAKGLQAAGLARIEGDLVADATYFDDERFLPGWNPADAGRWFCAQISPLALNDNCVDIYVDPTTPGSKAVVRVVPESDEVRVRGAPTTTGARSYNVLIHREKDTNEISVSGTISVRAKNWMDHVAVHDPAVFFASALRRVLEDAGIRVTGKVRKLSPDVVPPPRPVVLAEHKSKLRLDLPVINKRSQNLHAEMLLKTMGKKLFDEGSVRGGEKAIQRFLGSIDLGHDGLTIADGSGLSHENRVTARVLAGALDAMRRSPHAQLFRESLPVAGVDGTLRKRFGRHPHLHGQVLAKTGYIRGVSGLSGYVQRGGRRWSFSIVSNSIPRNTLRPILELQESIVVRVWEAMGAGDS